MIREKITKVSAKEKLKKMKKSSEKHIVREETRIMKYGAIGFSRNIWLSTAATAVMSITLIILFITVVASVILSNTADAMREKIDITIYLKPETSQEVLDSLSETIKKDSNVKEVSVSTSEQEYDKFIEENATNDEIVNVVKDKDMKKVMISKMQSTMRIKVYDVENLDSIKQLVKTDSGFEKNLDEEKSPTYDVNQAEIKTITTWARIARTGGIILGIVFLVISILIIFSTIRMAIFSRREEIYMMKLVGAGKNFIRGPFLVEAEICGVIAAIIAATLSYFGFTVLSPRLANYGINVASINNVMSSNKLILVYLIFITIGIIIGRISARLAVKKYLNKA